MCMVLMKIKPMDGDGGAPSVAAIRCASTLRNVTRDVCFPNIYNITYGFVRSNAGHAKAARNCHNGLNPRIGRMAGSTIQCK